jgi:hypothetical protein
VKPEAAAGRGGAAGAHAEPVARPDLGAGAGIGSSMVLASIAGRDAAARHPAP